MTYQHILYGTADGVATITLNRPEKLNALNERMLDEIRAALDAAKAEREVRAVLLTGAGRGFSAGQDLSDRAVRPDEEARDLGATLDRAYNPLMRRLRDLELPVVAAVNGVAAGAGCNLALAADIVVAARSAVFIQAFCRIGLVPDCGGTYWLPRLVGAARARALMLLGEPLSAQQAAEWGMIWRCVEDDRLMEEATMLARRLAEGPTRGLALTKRALIAASDNGLDAQLDLERDLQREAGFTEDYREGVAAFLEKRAPRFAGR